MFHPHFQILTNFKRWMKPEWLIARTDPLPLHPPPPLQNTGERISSSDGGNLSISLIYITHRQLSLRVLFFPLHCTHSHCNPLLINKINLELRSENRRQFSPVITAHLSDCSLSKDKRKNIGQQNLWDERLNLLPVLLISSMSPPGENWW